VSNDGSAELEFELRNVGDGPSVVDAATLGGERDDVLAVLLGSHYCPTSRELVKRLAAGHARFRDRATAVAVVLPDVRERASLWDEQYDLPFPLLADPGEDGFDALDGLETDVPELPGVALLERTDGGRLGLVDSWAVSGESPSVETLLDRLDEVRRSDGEPETTGQ